MDRNGKYAQKRTTNMYKNLQIWVGEGGLSVTNITISPCGSKVRNLTPYI